MSNTKLSNTEKLILAMLSDIQQQLASEKKLKSKINLKLVRAAVDSGEVAAYETYVKRKKEGGGGDDANEGAEAGDDAE